MIVSSARLQICHTQKKKKKKKITPPSQILCFILARVPRKSTGTTIGAAAQRGPVGAGGQAVSQSSCTHSCGPTTNWVSETHSSAISRVRCRLLQPLTQLFSFPLPHFQCPAAPPHAPHTHTHEFPVVVVLVVYLLPD
jgi:hypothetical protein